MDREIGPKMRLWLLSLQPQRLTTLDVDKILHTMLWLDPECAPAPTSPTARLVAASTFVSLLQEQQARLEAEEADDRGEG